MTSSFSRRALYLMWMGWSLNACMGAGTLSGVDSASNNGVDTDTGTSGGGVGGGTGSNTSGSTVGNNGGTGGGNSSGSDGSSGNNNGGASTGASSGSFGADVVPAGRGASVPWIEHQAEDAVTNATIIGPSRIKWDPQHIEAEAIGRKAVKLTKTGDYVEFTTTAPANSMVVRFSIPDSGAGGGMNATLGVYINGKKQTSLGLTSHFAWSYLGGTIGSTETDKPGPQPHTFFDDAHIGPADSPNMGNMPAGTKVRLQRDASDTAEFYIIDLVDFEQVAAPIPIPAGFTSVTQFGINPNDGKDHGDDIIAAMKGTNKLYFPPGEYLALKFVQNAANVGIDNHGTEVRGAGMWYTVLKGPKAIFFCDGAVACNYSDFAVFGAATARDEETSGVQKAFAGPLGSGSTLSNLWIEHEVGAIWVGNDPPYQTQPTTNLHIHDCRIRNTYADGVNLDNGTTNSVVEDVHFRNTGDDAAVVWSIKWSKWVQNKTYQMGPDYIKPEAKNAPDQGIGHGNTFNHITVQMPWRANCFAAYGGYDNIFKNSVCQDVLTYPGILIDNEFSSYPFGSLNTPAPSGNALTTFQNISLVRTGGQMFLETTATPWTHGALKFYMREGSVADVLVQDLDIIDPTYSGIEFRGFGAAYVPPGEKYDPTLISAAEAGTFSNITLKNIKITNAGTYGIEVLDNGGRGAINFDGVTVTGSNKGALLKGNAGATFFNKVGTGNSGW